MPCVITVCETCKREGWNPEVSGKTDGEELAELVEKAASGLKDITVRRHACLMGCDFACNIAIQQEDKLNYVLGKFEATETDAAGIVDYAKLYHDSETGQVPYRTWPESIKGHFRARLPVLDK